MTPVVSLPTVTPELLERAAASLPPTWRERPIFLSFRLYLKKNGRIGKEPLIPGTDGHASSTDPRTHRPLSVALADCRRRGLFLGLALPDGHTLIDEDGSIAPDGTIAPATLDRIRALNALTLRSISGIGTHTYVAGCPPENAVKPAGVEVYPGKRMALWTGDIIDGRDRIEERTALLAELFPPAQPAAPLPTTPLTLADDELLARAFAAVNGAELERLLAGDLAGYVNGDGKPDHSRADLAAASKLAFWTQDEVQIERIVSDSTLGDRKKWQTRAAYRRDTIARALHRSEFYTPPATIVRSGTTAQPAAPLAAEPQSLGFAPGPCADRVAELEAENAALRELLAARERAIVARDEKIAVLEQMQPASAKILANKSLGPARVVAATVATKLAWRASAGDTPPAENTASGAPPPGMMLVSVKEIAEWAGVSENTAGTHLKTLEERGLLRRHLKTVTLDADPHTGEIYDEPIHVTAHFVGPARIEALTPQTAIAFSRDLANFTTERVERRGGKRIPRCPDHPTADVIREYVDRCAKCRRQLNPERGHSIMKLPIMLLEPASDRSPTFGDPPTTVVDVLEHTNFGIQSTEPAEPNFGIHSTKRVGRTLVAPGEMPARIGRDRCLDCTGPLTPGGNPHYCDVCSGARPRTFGAPFLIGLDPAPPDRYTDVAPGARP